MALRQSESAGTTGATLMRNQTRAKRRQSRQQLVRTQVLGKTLVYLHACDVLLHALHPACGLAPSIHLADSQWARDGCPLLTLLGASTPVLEKPSRPPRVWPGLLAHPLHPALATVRSATTANNPLHPLPTKLERSLRRDRIEICNMLSFATFGITFFVAMVAISTVITILEWSSFKHASAARPSPLYCTTLTHSVLHAAIYTPPRARIIPLRRRMSRASDAEFRDLGPFLLVGSTSEGSSRKGISLRSSPSLDLPPHGQSGRSVLLVAAMFYDLNIPWPQPSGPSSSSAAASQSQSHASKKKSKQNSQLGSAASSSSAATPEPPAPPLSYLRDNDAAALVQLVLELSELRYSCVAFNHIVHSKYDPAVHPNRLAPHRDGRANPPFPELDPRTQAKGKAKATATSNAHHLTQLSRLTLVLDEHSMAKSGSGWVTNNATALQSYDLLAVRPTNEAAFQHACLTLSELKPFSIDIISLDFGAQPRLPFFLKRSTVNAALENGVQFEITYAPTLGADAAKARRNLISGARDLIRVTNGKGIFFSSAATEALALRAPYDVINLGAIFGLNPSAARDAISANCRSLLLRSQTRKTYRGVVSHPIVVPPTPKSAPQSEVLQAKLNDLEPNPDSETEHVGKKRKSVHLPEATSTLSLPHPAKHKNKKQKK